MTDPHGKNRETEGRVFLLPQRIKQWIDLFATRELLHRISLPIQIAVALAGLAIAVHYSLQWSEHSKALNDRIYKSLKANLDNTVWQHKGLAAYLLSEIDPKSASPNLTRIPVPPEVTTTLNKVDLKVKEQIGQIEQEGRPLDMENVNRVIQMLEPRQTPLPNSVHSPSDRERGIHIWEDPDSKVVKGAPVGQAIIAGGRDFFLSLPATALRREKQSHAPLDNTNQESLKKALSFNPDIVSDLDLVGQLVEVMKGFETQKIDGRSIVQYYFITESGLILLRSPQISNQWLFYSGYFDPHHNFTDRPYFKSAIKQEPIKGIPPPDGFDYESEPYIDLGGHGLVKTYSKRFELANRRYGVLCIDVTEGRLIAEIEKRLDALKPDDNTPTHEIRSLHIDQTKKVDEKSLLELPTGFHWLSGALSNKSMKPANLLGKIVSEHEIMPQTDDILRYTIPLNTDMSDDMSDGSRKVEIMLVTIDLKKFWNKQFWRIVYMCIGIALLLAATLNVFIRYYSLNKKFSELTEKMDRLMIRAENPYARLNSNNEFMFVNDSFLELLDYPGKAELEYEGTGTRRTFRSILTPESQKEYDKFHKTSSSGLPTSEYAITLLRRDKSKVKARVQGERIAFPTIKRKKYPHKLEIITSWEEVTDHGEKGAYQFGVRAGEGSNPDAQAQNAGHEGLAESRGTLLTNSEKEAVTRVSETAVLSERALAEDWDRPEEDEAWAHFQQTP